MDSKLLGGVLLIVGTAIGAGMLALPIATAQVGFVGSVFLLFGCWLVGLAWMATWFMVALCFRYSSLASLSASLLAPGYMWYITQQPIYTSTLLLMSIFLIIRHKSNIVKLIAGRESKL